MGGAGSSSSTHRSVDRDSSKLDAAGEMAASITVRLLPPSAFISSLVSTESRYGTSTYNDDAMRAAVHAAHSGFALRPLGQRADDLAQRRQAQIDRRPLLQAVPCRTSAFSHVLAVRNSRTGGAAGVGALGAR